MDKISYEARFYREQSPAWQLIEDCYTGDRAWTRYGDRGVKPLPNATRYLPKLPSEEQWEYEERLSQSHFSDKFAQAVRDFSGMVLLNGVRLVDVPDPILQHWANLDGQGEAGDRVVSKLATNALRFGHTFCLVDWSPTLGQPVWRHHSPLSVINARFDYSSGQPVPTLVVLRLLETRPQGEYGELDQTVYLKLVPGSWEKWIEVRDQRGTVDYRLEASGPYARRERGRSMPLPRIPLVAVYGGDRVGAFRSNPTLYSLAKLNFVHYQVSSDHRQKLHYCCFPTPVRVGGQGEDLVIGARTIVDVPLGGAFAWVEPNSQSLAMSRLDLKDIEEEIGFLSSDYLVKPGDRQAALTSQIGAQKIESELYLFASDLAAGVSQCLQQHAEWLGLPSGGRCELQTQFFDNLAADPQLLLAYARLRELDVLNNDELRSLASASKLFPESWRTQTNGSKQSN